MKQAHCLGLAALFLLQACASPARNGMQVEALLDRSDAQLTFIEGDGRALVIEVRSPSGIGNADLTLHGRLPKQIILWLMLRGMERLEIQYDQTIVTASLSSVPVNEVRETVRLPSGEEREISPTSPYWMAVEIVPAEGSAATIPLQEGTIQVRLPEALLKAKPRTFTIHWVDFFR